MRNIAFDDGIGFIRIKLNTHILLSSIEPRRHMLF